MAQAPRDVTVPKLRVLNTKGDIRAGALSNPYVLADRANRAAGECFIYPVRFVRRSKKGRQNKKDFFNI